MYYEKTANFKAHAPEIEVEVYLKLLWFVDEVRTFILKSVHDI